MPTQLGETDVVIVGMGAAGGVAAYPLAEAGLNVVGLEAGTWLDQRDFAPDEIRNNYRDWPMLVKKTEEEAGGTFFVPTVELRKSGWQFRGDELVGEPLE